MDNAVHNADQLTEALGQLGFLIASYSMESGRRGVEEDQIALVGRLSPRLHGAWPGGNAGTGNLWRSGLWSVERKVDAKIATNQIDLLFARQNYPKNL